MEEVAADTQANEIPPAPVTPETPTQPEQAAQTVAPEEPAKSDPVDRRATLREQMIAKGLIKPANPNETRIQERARDQQGRFVQSAAPKAASPSPSSTPSVAAPVESIPLPKSLKKELEAHWKAAHPEFQKALLQRDSDYDKGIQTYRQKAEQAEALLNEFKPYENIMRMTGGSPQTALRSILPTMAVLTTGSPAEKAMVLARAAQQYGVPLEMIGQVAQQGYGAVANDPYHTLAQQVQQLTQAFSQTQQASQQAEQMRLQRIAESYGQDKPHFNDLRPQMWSLLQAQTTAEQQGVPGPLGDRETTSLWGEQQWIEQAYQAALRLNPSFYESELQRQRDEAARAEREKANQAAQAARAAAVQVRGAPSPVATGGAVDPRDRRAVLAAALRSRI